MPEQGKIKQVIKGLECCVIHVNCAADGGCPYRLEADANCLNTAIKDAIALLKAQEPVTVIPAIKKNDELLTEGSCPICGAKLDYYLNGQFCGCCGRRLKWDG